MPALLPILAAFTLLLVGQGLVQSLTSLNLVNTGYSNDQAGWVLSSYYMGYVIGGLKARPLIQRLGAPFAYGLFTALFATSVLLQALWVDLVYWSLLRALAGFAMIALFITTESWLNALACDQIRGRIYALYMMLNYIGLSSGQLLLNLGEVSEFRLFAVASLLVLVSMVPVLVYAHRAPQYQKSTDAPGLLIKLFEIARRRPIGVLGCVAAGAMTSAFYTSAPIYAHRMGLDTLAISQFMAAGIMAGFALQWPIGHLSDRWGRPGVMVLASGVALVALLPGFTTSSPDLKVMLCTLTGTGLCLTFYATSVSLTNDGLNAQEAIATSAGLFLAHGLGALMGPICSTLLMTRFGPGGLWIFMAILSAGVCLCTMLSLLSQRLRYSRSARPRSSRGGWSNRVR